ncbi:hypothetical protein [Rubrivivax rivuli]|uniref:Uncharacterized protein n=1 Tax=Rubrivivax rivuli TaxID=1862385 RepID=A0A437RS09_9BURK|nr:hypothetical protein [Rubrivivax rivuli]RVU49525.1 hypothetical protein EOE66_02860 [Rubrivivax rivuli]
MYPTSEEEEMPPRVEDVNAEIAALLELKPKVRRFSKFQDDTRHQTALERAKRRLDETTNRYSRS